MKVIIYNGDSGVVAVIRPTNIYLDFVGGDVHIVARKDVPTGKKYKIIDGAEVPSREYRGAWVVDETELTDGEGS